MITFILKVLSTIGSFFILLGRMFGPLKPWRIYWRRFIHEMEWMGTGSLPLVIVISVFVGAVTTVQTAYQLVSAFIPISVIGSVVSDSTLLELAPTLTALILAGRISSSIASELATMKITEQIDALEVMGVHVETYLILPKVVSAVIIVPALIVVASAVGIGAGAIVGHITGIVPLQEFVRGAQATFRDFNVVICLSKAFVYSLIISTVPAKIGMDVSGGALEVGRASTRAVVISSLLVVLFDYIVAETLLD